MKGLFGIGGRVWIVVVLCLGMTVSGCANKAQTGSGVGALGGGLLGSLLGPSKNEEQNALIGATIGGVFGYMLGNEMDKADQKWVNQTYEYNRDHQTSRWVNPNSGNQYAVTPRFTTVRGGRYCRQAEIQSIIDGRQEIVVKMACRRADGRWEF